MTVAHEHNADRTRENGWAYWRCTGCGQLCHYVPAQPNPAGTDFYGYCACCTDAGTMPCLACGDPCQVTDYVEHIRTKHPSCPACLVIEGSALGTGCTCDKSPAG